MEKKRKCTEETSLQLVKRQVTFQVSSMKNKCWDSSHKKSRELDKLICEMVALQDLPFNFIEVRYRRFVHAAQPKYDLKNDSIILRICVITFILNFMKILKT